MSNVTVNDSAVQNLFLTLNPENRKKVMLTALKAGGEKLASNTKI